MAPRLEPDPRLCEIHDRFFAELALRLRQIAVPASAACGLLEVEPRERRARAEPRNPPASAFAPPHTPDARFQLMERSHTAVGLLRAPTARLGAGGYGATADFPRAVFPCTRNDIRFSRPPGFW